MHNKLYEKLIKFIKENYLILLLYIVLIATLTYPLPYYIYTGGGIINIDDKIKMEDSTSSTGSYNMCYVSEINATIPTYIASHILSSWDLISKEELLLNKNETNEDIVTRDKIYLRKANQNAIINAYTKASKTLKITNKHNYVIYVSEKSKTGLKIGDEILAINDKEISSIDDISDLLIGKKEHDTISIKAIHNNKIVIKNAEIYIENTKPMLGIAIETVYDYKTNPTVEFNFSNNESGPSGGLMLSLALYDKLSDEDITKGYKIAGTGTIDEDGNIGSIGGVEYKLKGAVKAKADIFLVPLGENYEDSLKLLKKEKYNIKLIGVSTLDEAISKLKEL